MNDGLIGSFTWPFDWGRKILSLFYRWFWGRSSGEGNGYHPVFLPRKFQKQRCPVGYSPCGPKELDSTEWLTLPLSHFHVICRYNPKENSNTTPRRALKNCRGRKSTKKSIVPLFLEKGMIQCINLFNLWTSANGLTGWSRLQRHMFGKLVVRRSEEKVYGRPFQIVWWFVSHVNARQRVTLAENNFSNQVWDSCCMGTLTSLTTPIIALWVHELTAVTAEMEVIHVLSIVDFLSKRLIWLHLLLSAQF